MRIRGFVILACLVCFGSRIPSAQAQGGWLGWLRGGPSDITRDVGPLTVSPIQSFDDPALTRHENERNLFFFAAWEATLPFIFRMTHTS